MKEDKCWASAAKGKKHCCGKAEKSSKH